MDVAHESAVFPRGWDEWFTIHTHPKHEHIAAANLSTMLGVETWNPRIVFTRGTRRGPATVTESVFPGYIFGRFNLAADLDAVRYTPGVATVVHFGSRYPTIPLAAIAQLKTHFDDGEVTALSHDISEGEKVLITAGSLCGIEAVVLRSLPARKRVQVLLELLGTCTAVELDLNAISVQRRHPRSLAA